MGKIEDVTDQEHLAFLVIMLSCGVFCSLMGKGLLPIARTLLEEKVGDFSKLLLAFLYESINDMYRSLLKDQTSLPNTGGPF
jgi:hypothetical protein